MGLIGGEIVLNVFRVRLEKLNIPKIIYVYNVLFKTNEKNKIIASTMFLRNTFGFLDENSGKLYSYKEIKSLPKPIKDSCDLTFDTTMDLDELNEDIQRYILCICIRRTVEGDIKKALKEIEGNVLKKKFVGRWIVSLGLEGDRVEVTELDGVFYIAFNIKLNIIGNKNLWDFVKRDKSMLKRLCWNQEKSKDVKIWFKYIPDIKEGDDKSYILTKVYDKAEVKSGLTFEDLKKYPIEKRGLTEDEVKRIAKYSEFDENQPIIEGSPNLKTNKSYGFLPQYCIPAYSPLLASEDENKLIMMLRNELIFRKKDQIVSVIVRKVGYLENAEVEITKLADDIPLKAKFIKVKLCLEEGKIRVRGSSKVYEKRISSTSELFGWIQNYLRLRKGLDTEIEVEIPIPDYVPECLDQVDKLETFLILENNLNEAERIIFENLIKHTIKIYNLTRQIYEQIGIKGVPYLDFKGKSFTFENSARGVSKVVEEILNSFNGDLGFALIFGKSKGFSEEDDDAFDYYVPLKRLLFNNEILSQNFVLEEYLNDNGVMDRKRIEYALSNIVYNIFGKLGIKFFVLEERVPYDYILGVDVGFGEAYTGRVAGCTTVHDSEGRLKNIIPVSKQNLPEKESARIKPLLEYIESKRKIYKIDFKGKSILILRDGKIQREEVEQLKEFSKSRNCKIVIIDVKKNTLYQLLRKDKSAYYVKLGAFYLVKAHNPRTGFPRLIKISQKVVIEGDIVKLEKPTEEDVLLIYRLTALNYSTIGKPSNLRIPSPVYYADKLVKALKRGWDFKEDYLKDGILYFL